MECSIIYKIIKTSNGIYLLPLDFTIVQKENTKLKVIMGDLKDLQVKDLESCMITEDDEYVGIVFKTKTLEDTYQVTGYEALKEMIQLKDYIFKIDASALKKTTYEDLVLSEVKSNIIGQDKQIEELLSAILYNQKLYYSNLSNNEYKKLKKSIIASGPTGVGKTESVKMITDMLNIPTVYVDMTKYVYTGMEEGDVAKILLKMLKESDYDVENCERGIVIFDNFDKLVDLMNSSNQRLFADFILKTIGSFNDDRYLEITREGFEPIEFHKDCLTFIFVGDFDKLLKTHDKTIGYKISEEDKPFREKHKNNTYINEILYFVTDIIEFKELTKEDLMTVLLESKSSPLYLKAKFYHELGKKISFDEEYLKDIIDKAYELKEGAKGLRYLIEESLIEDEPSIIIDKADSLLVKKDGVVKKVKAKVRKK